MHSSDRTLLSKLGFADPDKRDRRHDLACQYLAQPEQASKLARMIPFRQFDKERSFSFEVNTFGSAFGNEQSSAVLGRLERSVRELKTRNSDGLWSNPWYLAGLSGFRASDHMRYRKGNAKVTITTEASYSGPIVCLEKHLTKGDGQYKSSIGFLDYTLQVERRLNSVANVASEVICAEIPTRYFEASGQEQRTCEDNIDMLFVGNGSDLLRYPNGEAYIRIPLKDVLFKWGYEIEKYNALIEVKINRVSIGDVLRQVNLYREYRQWDLVVLATAYPITRCDAETFLRAGIHPIRLSDGFDSFCEQQKHETSFANCLEL